MILIQLATIHLHIQNFRLLQCKSTSVVQPNPKGKLRGTPLQSTPRLKMFWSKSRQEHSCSFTKQSLCVWCTAKQSLRRWCLQQWKALFTRQPGEATRDQVSDPPPWRPRAWDICGIKELGGLRLGERWLEVGKSEVISVLQRYIWETCFFVGGTFKSGGTYHGLRVEFLVLWTETVIHGTPAHAQVWGQWSQQVFSSSNLS